MTNLSPVDAADVNVVRVSERSHRLKVLSLTPSQGTCAQDSCNLGRLVSAKLGHDHGGDRVAPSDAC